MSASKGGGGPAIRYRPVFGGVFGRSGEYVMATMPCIERGLDSVRYMVLHPKTGGVLAVANDKTTTTRSFRGAYGRMSNCLPLRLARSHKANPRRGAGVMYSNDPKVAATTATHRSCSMANGT